MTGGSGEKKTIPLVAKYFDHLKYHRQVRRTATQVQVVKERCEQIGRDPATLETSMQQAAVGGPEQVADQIKTKVLDAGINLAPSRRWPKS